MKSPIAVAVVVTILVCLPLALRAEPNAEKLNISVVVDDQGLMGKSQQVTAAWLGYAMARANWVSDQVKALAIDPKSYAPTFAEELAGRESLAAIWSELKAKDTTLVDAYLDQIQKVKEAGFLREYVWMNLRRASWTVEPTDLRQAAYAEWAKANLAGHVVETHADARIVNAKTK